MDKLLKGFAVCWFKSDVRRWWLHAYYNFIPKLLHKKQSLDVFLALSDPYSFVLVQTLPALEKRFHVKINLFLMYEKNQVSQTGKLWREWTITDANHFAHLYGLQAITQEPEIRSLVTGQQVWQLQSKNVANAISLFKQTWLNQFTEFYGPSTPVINFQIKNQQKQIRKGHYQSASIYFAGEWYVGVERLGHLEQRLNKIGVSIDKPESLFNKHHLTYQPSAAKLPQTELTVYLSICSPYSYLGWLQAVKLSQSYQIPIKAKLVLPLLMRGIQVPIEKQRYILFDALREARVKNLPVGKLTRPLADGVTAIYRIFPYMESINKSFDYLNAIFSAVYVEGLDLAKADNLKKICLAIDVDYEQALQYSATHDWQLMIDANQQQIEQLGFWGVPCFTFQNVACWGQDRLFLIEQAILNSTKIKSA